MSLITDSTDMSSLSDNASEFGSMIGNDTTSLANKSFTNSLLKPPPEKQGTLDLPPPPPKPNDLGQSKITQFYQPKEEPPIAVQKFMEKEREFFSKETQPFVDDTTTFVRPMDFVTPKTTKILPDDDEFERQNENPELKKKPKEKKPKKLKNQYKDEEFSVEGSDQDIYVNTTEKPKKKLGRPPGSKNKAKETTVVPK